ncbi:MAG: 5'/3'-nucleotidase SurE [Candidatus Coatesbacteria bacterium]|nr:5'/3'-nucleotidase SurE [Candidatus Coatesbacteria bacterium]
MTKTTKHHLLLSNDDGVHSPGLHLLARRLRELGELMICAPMFERSGASHAITLNRSIQVSEVTIEEGMCAVATDGKPADCVKYAVSNLYSRIGEPDPVIREDEPVPPVRYGPDLVVSGINSGLNLATHIFYSGTVGAAMEGAFLGIPSVAVSLGTFNRPPGGAPVEGALENAARISARLCARFLELGLPPFTCVNINIPNIPPAELRGIRLTRHGRFGFDTRYRRDDDDGGWRLSGKMSEIDDEENPELDYVAILENCVSVTPLDLDLNSHKLHQIMSGHDLGVLDP